MKRIVVCFDGTWNKPADEALAVDQRVETNVRRFYQSITDRGSDGAKQVKWYDEGGRRHPMVRSLYRRRDRGRIGA
jgi:uncharacterized protein (DUF2235 family)